MVLIPSKKEKNKAYTQIQKKIVGGGKRLAETLNRNNKKEPFKGS